MDTELDHGLVYADEGKNYYDWLGDTFAAPLRQAVEARGAKGLVIEQGAGVGTLSEVLMARRVGPMALTEPDPKLVDVLKQKFAGRGDVAVVHATVEEYLEQHGPGCADAVVSSNVLEHVVDDEACLGAIWKLLRPGGTLALYVPARPELYGEFDRRVGHQRRYRREDLQRKLKNAQFEPRTLRYRNLAGALGWLILGAALSNRSVGQGSVLFHDRVVFPVMRVFEDWIPIPYGSNLLCIAHKKDES
jgi:SAM-dependent methyltransferase